MKTGVQELWRERYDNRRNKDDIFSLFAFFKNLWRVNILHDGNG
jgi:hypothetical protein